MKLVHYLTHAFARAAVCGYVIDEMGTHAGQYTPNKWSCHREDVTCDGCKVWLVDKALTIDKVLTDDDERQGPSAAEAPFL